MCAYVSVCVSICVFVQPFHRRLHPQSAPLYLVLPPHVCPDPGLPHVCPDPSLPHVCPDPSLPHTETCTQRNTRTHIHTHASTSTHLLGAVVLLQLEEGVQDGGTWGALGRLQARACKDELAEGVGGAGGQVGHAACYGPRRGILLTCVA